MSAHIVSKMAVNENHAPPHSARQNTARAVSSDGLYVEYAPAATELRRYFAEGAFCEVVRGLESECFFSPTLLVAACLD